MYLVEWLGKEANGHLDKAGKLVGVNTYTQAHTKFNVTFFWYATRYYFM